MQTNGKLHMFVLIICILMDVSLAYGTCDDVFHIEKYTVASTDSYREAYYSSIIFPYLNPSDTQHFHQGECAQGMKVELPDSCFKIHAPTTWQHDEGLLSVETLEKKWIKKWKHVMSEKSTTFNFDSFLDFNIAFWVKSLDPYIEKWETFNLNGDDSEPLYGHTQLEYIGMEWFYNSNININLQINDFNYKNNKWYSILIHSPGSGMIYEFLSYAKPKYYDNIAWIDSNIQRATFKAFDILPWNRPDSTPIVPVRIARATTDIASMVEFYVTVMEAEILYNAVIIDDLGGDNIETLTVFLRAGDSQIELQFLERPAWYTAGDFTLKQYEDLLIETHDEVITTPFCGIDRWFDNHYGVSTWSNTRNGVTYMDRIITQLNMRNKQKYRIYQTSYEHSSPNGKMNLDKYGATSTYILFVFEPSGQTIQLMGDLKVTNFGGSGSTEQVVPQWNAQWCYTRCPDFMRDGHVNINNIYVDHEVYDDFYDDYNDIQQSGSISMWSNSNQIKLYPQSNQRYYVVSFVLISVVVVMYLVWKNWTKQFVFNDTDEQIPLI